MTSRALLAQEVSQKSLNPLERAVFRHVAAVNGATTAEIEEALRENATIDRELAEDDWADRCSVLDDRDCENDRDGEA